MVGQVGVFFVFQIGDRKSFLANNKIFNYVISSNWELLNILRILLWHGSSKNCHGRHASAKENYITRPYSWEFYIYVLHELQYLERGCQNWKLIKLCMLLISFCLLLDKSKCIDYFPIAGKMFTQIASQIIIIYK